MFQVVHFTVENMIWRLSDAEYIEIKIFTKWYLGSEKLQALNILRDRPSDSPCQMYINWQGESLDPNLNVTRRLVCTVFTVYGQNIKINSHKNKKVCSTATGYSGLNCKRNSFSAKLW